MFHLWQCVKLPLHSIMLLFLSLNLILCIRTTNERYDVVVDSILPTTNVWNNEYVSFLSFYYTYNNIEVVIFLVQIFTGEQ